jgi:hypothetical protein
VRKMKDNCIFFFLTLLLHVFLLPAYTQYILRVCFLENAEGLVVSGLCALVFLRLTVLLRQMPGIPT